MTKQITHSKRLILSFWNKKMQLLVVAVALLAGGMQAQVVITATNAGSGSLLVPTGVTSMTVECWGGGGAGGSASGVSVSSARIKALGGGGAGGSYAQEIFSGPSAGTYSYSVGAGATPLTGTGYANLASAANGGNTTFSNLVPAVVVKAVGGASGQSVNVTTPTAGIGLGGLKVSTGNTGSTSKYGGSGGNAGETPATTGAGGASAGATDHGGDANLTTAGSATGTGGGVDGASGGAYEVGNSGGPSGKAPGAGGAGAYVRATGTANRDGGYGGAGQIRISLTGTTLSINSGEILTIPSGGTLTIPTGTTLTVASGGTLTVSIGGKLINNGTITNNGTINMNGEMSNIGAALVDGSGTITVAAAITSTLNISNAEGLDPTTGSIRCSTRTFPINANYGFIGTVAQVPGAEFPVTVNNLTVNNTAGLTLSTALTVNAVLALTNGVLTNGSNLTLGNTASINRTDGSLSATPNFGTNKTITYSGTNPITPGPELSSPLTSLTVTNTAGVTFSDPLTVSGVTAINATGKLILANTITATGGLTVATGAVLQLNEGGNVTGTVTYTTDATLVLNKTSNTTFNGVSAGTIWPSAGSPKNINILQNTLTVAPSQTLTIVSGGTFTVSSGAIVSNTGTIANSGTLTVNGEISNSSSSAVSGTGAFNLNAGATIYVSHTDGINNTTGPITCSTKTYNAAANYVFNGTASQVLGANIPSSVNNLTVNNSAGLTKTKVITINGVLYLTNGVFTKGTGNTTLGNSASINRSGGSLSEAPTFGTTKTIIYSGTSPITPSNELITPINSLTVSNTGGVTFSNALTVSGATSITGKLILANTFTANDALTVSAAGTLQLNDNAALAGSGAISYTSGGTLAFNKTANTTIGGSEGYWPASNGPTKINVMQNTLSLDVDKTIAAFTVSLGATLVANNNKHLTVTTLTNNGTVDIASGAKLTNSGTITNNGTINFLSDATNGTATYIGGAIGGTVNVNQSLQHSDTWRTWYISSPVSETVAPTPALNRIKSFDEAANKWSDPLTQMQAKIGYLVVPVDATKDLLFTGTLNTGDQDITLTGRDGVGDNQGFNLVGNPYPSYLNWQSVYDYSTDANVTYPNRTALRSSTMWYRTKVSNDYFFWTVTGDGTVSPANASKYIPPMQAFWVRSAVGTKTLALTDAMRAHAPATNKLLKAPAAKNLERTLVRLEVSNGVNTDEAVIYFSENAQNGLDMYDAPKMNNDNSAIPEIHTILGNEKIVINAMNSIPMDTPIGLGFVAGNATSFSLRANEISNLPEGVKLMLRDNVTFAETDLTDGITNYSFAPEETSIDRFSVIFRSAGVATGINNAINTNMSAYYNNSKITVLCGDDKLIGSELSVYNAVGQKIVSKQLLGSKMQVEGLFVPGVYILKANNTTTKVIVK